MASRKEIIELMVGTFPRCPICGSGSGYDVTSIFKGNVQCKSCQAEWSSADFIKSTRLEKMKIKELPHGAHSCMVGKHVLRRYEEYPIGLWKSLGKEEERKFDLGPLMVELSILFMIVAIGGYFRLANLTEISSWHDYDEGVHSQAAILYIQGYRPYKDFFFTHPPLILYVLSVLYRFNGANLGAGRMFSAVLSTLTIIIIYFIGRMSGSSITGLIASAFVAFDGYTVYNSRKLMLEPTVSFFACLSYSAFLLSIEKKDRGRKDWLMILSGVFIGLSMSTKMSALFNWAPLFIYLVLKREKRDLRLFLLSSLASAGVLSIPFLAFARGEILKQVLIFQLLRPPDGTPRSQRFAWMTSFPQDMIIVNLGICSLIIFLLAYFILNFLPTAYRASVSTFGPHVTVPILWVLSVLFMFLTARSFYEHYIEQIIPPFALLIGNLATEVPNAISSLRRKGRIVGKFLKTTLTFMFTLAIIAQLIIINAEKIHTWENDEPRRVANELAEFTAPGDRILIFEPLFTFMAERTPAGLMCDSYGTMLYRGLGLYEEDLTSAFIRAFTEKEDRPWPMHDPKAQEYIMNLIHQSDYVVIGDWMSKWQLTQETIDYILAQTSIAGDLGSIKILARSHTS